MLDTLEANKLPTTAPKAAPTGTAATALAIGAELRRIVGAELAAPFARAPRRIGDLTVELVRSRSTWRLYLADLSPIRHTTRDLWATAVSAPSVDWQRTPDVCLVWCEWTEPTT